MKFLKIIPIALALLALSSCFLALLGTVEIRNSSTDKDITVFTVTRNYPSATFFSDTFGKIYCSETIEPDSDRSFFIVEGEYFARITVRDPAVPHSLSYERGLVVKSGNKSILIFNGMDLYEKN